MEEKRSRSRSKSTTPIRGPRRNASPWKDAYLNDPNARRDNYRYNTGLRPLLVSRRELLEIPDDFPYTALEADLDWGVCWELLKKGKIMAHRCDPLKITNKRAVDIFINFPEQLGFVEHQLTPKNPYFMKLYENLDKIRANYEKRVPLFRNGRVFDIKGRREELNDFLRYVQESVYSMMLIDKLRDHYPGDRDTRSVIEGYLKV